MICRISNMVIADDSNMSLNGKVCQNLIGVGKIKKNESRVIDDPV